MKRANCPFCKNEETYIIHRDCYPYNYETGYQIGCGNGGYPKTGCFCTGPWAKTLEEAEILWNQSAKND
jgi:hypothetical protein